jgi:hypothetical protein
VIYFFAPALPTPPPTNTDVTTGRIDSSLQTLVRPIRPHYSGADRMRFRQSMAKHFGDSLGMSAPKPYLSYHDIRRT